jgi:signal transduction histidine kinase
MLLDAPSTSGARGETLAAIDTVERLLSTRVRPGGEAAAAVADGAQRARDLCRAAEFFPSRLVDLCLEEMLSLALFELCVEVEDRYDVAFLLDTVAEQAGQPPARFRLQLARGALGGARLAAVRGDVAIDGLLAMLSVLAPVHEASVWERDDCGAAALVAQVGLPPSESSRAAADEVLAQDPFEATRSGTEYDDLLALPVAGTASRPFAALVAGAKPADHAWIANVLEHAATALAAILERAALLERCSARESSLSEACERRLGRLALDLHDGPLQNVAGITGDLKLLRHRFEIATAGSADGPRLLGSVGDLEARLGAIDTELRDLSHSLESPAIAGRPLTAALADEAESFRRRCDIALSVELRGELDELTSSQRTALVRIVQEWLSNIREHSRARAVRLLVCGGRDRLTAEVTDDGCGFDVAATLLEAGRRGRLGLVGVSERARLLGGSCEIHSRPGGPTKLLVDLPRWRPGPLAGAAESPAQG